METANIQTPVAPKTRTELKVIQISKHMEQDTINRYQCFGWELKNNQEVNVTRVSGGGNANGTYVSSKTTTYIKLTFERNTGIENYSVLNEKYQEYSALETKYNEIEEKIANTKFLPLPAIIAGVIAFLLCFRSFFGSFLQFMGMIYGISIGFLVAIIVGYIGGAIKKSSLKKTSAPVFSNLEKEMNRIANEAAEYLV